MLVFLSVSVAIISFAALLYSFSEKQKPQQQPVENQNIKIKHILEARDLISKNEKIKFMTESMTNLYEREETPWVKDQRTQIMNKLSTLVYDTDMVAAICAIAKMEASKRRAKKNGKRVSGKIEVRGSSNLRPK